MYSMTQKRTRCFVEGELKVLEIAHEKAGEDVRNRVVMLTLRKRRDMKRRDIMWKVYTVWFWMDWVWGELYIPRDLS